MKIRLLYALILGLTISFMSCKTTNKPGNSVETKEYFGEKIKKNKAITAEELAFFLEDNMEFSGQLKGKVESVCKVKGCWMNVSGENGGEVFIQFKDYGFFMPMDIEGQEVIMQGKGYYEITTVDELKHYAEDEGKSEEEIAKITEPEKELKFMADGVILLK